MKIEQLDKNFEIVNDGDGGEKAVYTIPHEKFDLYGVYYSEEEKRFRRVPKEVADNISYNLSVLATNTAGGRLRFCTNSGTIGIEATYPFLAHMTHMPYTGSNSFYLLEKTESGFKYINVFRPNFGEEKGFKQTIKIRGGAMREFILFFPLYNSIDSLKVILDADAKIENGSKYRDIKPILYYGSSITQGGCASRTDGAYQALISKWNDIDFINLGFSGGCKAEDIMVDYICGLDVSLFVLDYDHNAPSVDYLKETHYSTYLKYRKFHPDTPILMLSRPNIEGEEQNIARFKVIKATYDKAKKDGDKNVYFIPGKQLFKKEDRINCTVDGCHPNDLGFYRMAKRIYKELIKIDEKFR
ncbi:MAG: hypothetical protein IJX03_06415 [Clostridia bacterium]|nr:hypothetical protein [Clostridia bacterium]